MSLNTINRRHALGLFAGIAGVGIATQLGMFSRNTLPTAHWRGIALGGEASMTLAHPHGEKAKEVLSKAVAELKRLEAIFSIYDPASAISKLNRDEALENPPMELVSLLSAARSISEKSNGRFDITVQPLWEQRYNQENTNSQAEALALVGQEHIKFNQNRIALALGQKITLNGIAQGAITDHLIQLLKREGFDNVLLNTGEIRSLGSSPDGDTWNVALESPDGEKIKLSNMAVATSSISANKAHLFDPKTGQGGSLFKSVSVIAPTATLADGLSTTLSLTPEEEWEQILQHYEQSYIYAERHDDTSFRVRMTSIG